MSETVNVAIAGTPTSIILADNAIDAAASAAKAEAFSGPTYASQAAGEAATVNGQYFAVNVAGIVSIYLRTSTASTLQRTMLTTDALSATGGAGLTGSNDLASGTLWTTVAGFITYLRSSAGSAIVGFIASGTGAVLRNIRDKLRESVSVSDYYNTADPDDTLSFTRALATGKKVYMPAAAGHGAGGKYVVDVATLVTGSYLYGDGATSIISQSPSYVGVSTGSLYANSGSAGATIDNLTLRDFRIEGTNIVAPVFSQFKHLISLNGVKNVLIENVQIIGFQGDGLYLGSGVVGGDERHNTNIKVRDCLFDGINRENRNGISVIDGKDGIISGNTFQNCSKSTMPGALDIEPDDAAFHILKNWIVENNLFKNNGGNLANICMIFPPLVPLPAGFLIRNNIFDDYVGSGAEITVDARRTLTTASASMQILIDGNIGKLGNRVFDIFASKGVTITDTNQFEDYTGSSIMGSVGATDLALDLVENATYIRVGSGDTRGTRIGKVNGATFGGKKIECATDTSSSYPYQFVVAVVLNVTFEGLRITKRPAQTIAINDTGATFTAAGNKFRNNFLDGMTSQFPSVTAVTASGTGANSWTGTITCDANANTGTVDVSISGGTLAAGTLAGTVPAGYRPRAAIRGLFGSGTGIVELRFDPDGSIFITPNAAPAATIRGSITYSLAV